MLASRFPGFARNLRYAKFNLRDIYDTYVARPRPLQATPLGFIFGGSSSRHHAAMREGIFEPLEVALLTALFPHTDRFIDIGANVGYFTCLARHCGKPALAVEPMPRNLSALFINLEANGWHDTEVQPLAASNHVGIQTLFGASSTGASLIDRWAGAPSLFRRTICVSTLDNIVGSRFTAERLMIKIDVEGHEHSALQGSRSLLDRACAPVWLIELTFHEYHPGGNNPTFQSCFELFFSRLYRAFLLGPDGLAEITLRDVKGWVGAGRTSSASVNYLFVPADLEPLVPSLMQAAIRTPRQEEGLG